MSSLSDLSERPCSSNSVSGGKIEGLDLNNNGNSGIIQEFLSIFNPKNDRNVELDFANGSLEGHIMRKPMLNFTGKRRKWHLKPL